ncbi:peroxide stress protein YaaA [Candidatus Pandoraea novymonadis]|uniref:UPF0246 protein BZL35_00398 n=1 Tax=Candidatus Pandoraea novymonadis TaxID=1808959 RepID=A0ABX5FGD1_9BURK|nr:peroxide stress protein YaaA [Candidatus Pandoraea novymonadis]PSB92167.1 hypothetical protein BZL35_00398 [Candidatus Pandoraea novymonadis]
MIILLSPAKTLDYETPSQVKTHTVPQFIEEAAELIEGLRTLSPEQISSLMRISASLAAINFSRYAEWTRNFDANNAKQAILAFNGDVYEGLSARTLSAVQLEFAQNHLRIFSGLYGVLRPLDLLKPYRLEMGTRFANSRGRDLYTFWSERVTHSLNALLLEYQPSRRVLVNLASQEYFKVVNRRIVDAPVITPVFEDWKGGKYKIISFYTKRARGMMARFAIENSISDIHQLKNFCSEGYVFDVNVSSEALWIFRRKVIS